LRFEQILILLLAAVVGLSLALWQGADRLRTERDSLKKEIASLQSKLKDLKLELVERESSLNSLTERFAALQKKCQTTTQSLLEELNSLKQGLAERDETIRSLASKLEAYELAAKPAALRKGSGIPPKGFGASAVAADFDRDGDLDLYIANGYNYSQDNAYLLNNGDGTFALQDLDKSGLPRGGASTGAVAADFDRDGDLDLYVSNSLNQDNFYALNKGDGTFIAQDLTKMGLQTGGYSLGKPVAADFDNDGDLDLYVPNSGDDFYALNNGDGTFIAQDLEKVGLLLGGTSTAAMAADFNRDGKLDLFITNGIRAQSGRPVPEDNFYALGNGDGTFSTQDLEAAGLPRGGASSGVVAADFDNDGDLDLLVANADPYLENFYCLNDGDGTFTCKDPASVGLAKGSGVGSYSAVAADFNRDGNIDLYIANGGLQASQDNIYALSNGDGTFTIQDLKAAGLPLQGNSFDALAADFDRDGDLDLFVTNINYVQDNFYALNSGYGVFVTIPLK